MKTDLNHDQIAMHIEHARNERSIALGRLIAMTLHKLFDWIERGTKNTQAKPAQQAGYHLNSEGRHTNSFDTSAFV